MIGPVPGAPGEDEVRAGAILEIDLGAIAANWRSLAERVTPAQCGAVVKADAYGLGAGPVSLALAAAGCRLFFTATFDEAIALEEILPNSCEIAILNGPLPSSARELARHRLVPVINHLGQLAEWARAAALCGPRPAMLHVDTGMARLGLSRCEFDEVANGAVLEGPIRWRALISHLACADTPRHPLNDIQLQRFVSVQSRFGRVAASLAASSGIFLGPEYHFDFVRPGAALYGINPQPEISNPMRQVVRIKGRILQVREVDADETVGYGATHVMSAPGRLATVGVGYGDGWPRSLSRRGSGSVGGVRVPLLGRVSMDLVVFDVSAADPSLARPGAFVELLHDHYGVDAVAADAGTIGYEILTSLGRRYHRIYRGASDQC